MRTIFLYVKPKLRAMSLGFLIKLSGTMIELLLPWMLSVILDTYVPAENAQMIWLWGVGMLACSALALMMNVAANRMATATARDVTRKIRYDLFDRVLHLSASQEDAFTTPSLISRLTSDTYNVHQMVDRMQRLGVRAPIMLLGGVTITVFLEPVLALVLIATLPILGVLVYFISSRGVKLYSKTQSALDAMIRRAQESMVGMKVIQALSKSAYESERFDQTNRDFVKLDQNANLLMNLSNPAMNLILNLGLTLVIVVGAFRVDSGTTQSGAIIAFLSYFTMILNALMMVSRLFVLFSKGSASAKRIEAVLTAPKDMPVLTEASGSIDDVHITFEDVSFSYQKRIQNLSHISFSLKKGETLGIIGPTGSGKTTLIQLMLRLYDPDQGRILIEGKDLRSIPPELVSTQFGVVFQNDFLFSDDIKENIRFGRDLTTEQIQKAAALAQADFILAKKDGFSERLSAKGSNLSGGQKQRVLLARALAANPPILILDDSSSALDYKTDAAFRQALSTELLCNTKIIIAQRISSIRHASQIMMLDGGAVVGFGTHQELMTSCPEYQKIAEIQMGEVD